MTRDPRFHAGILFVVAVFAFDPRARADGLTGIYLGGSMGTAKISTDNAAFQNAIEGDAEGLGILEFTSASLKDRNTAWWVNTGYMAWSYVGIDASYLHLGELTNQVSGTFTPSGGTSESIGATTKLRSEGPALGLLLQLPLLENFDFNLRIADYYSRTTLTNIFSAATSMTTVQKASGSSLLLGVGASYSFLGHWSARLDYLHVEHAGDSETGKYNASMLAVGASYTF
jgi:opacity protein-like surface antigen